MKTNSKTFVCACASAVLSTFAVVAVLIGGPVRAEDAQPFTVAVTTPAGKAGSSATARVTLKPGAGYHMNREFPTSLKLVAPAGVDLAKATLSGKDPAIKLSESELSVDVQFTPRDVGKKKITGTLKFAVCTATSCDPRSAPVSIDVDAK